MKLIYICFIVLFFVGCKNSLINASYEIIAEGQMPNIVKDKDDHLHLVYGSGETLFYSTSTDNGKHFSKSTVISVIPNLAASHMRGPQIACTSSGLVLTVCNDMGDIFSFIKNGSSAWQASKKVNDVDTVAKENLMSLSADADNAFAVWLDIRDGHNKIYGAASTDAGKSWNKNVKIYESPDTTVCECCKPSVIVKGNNVYVMFRNWLHGNRDLHLIQSSDGGATFGTAQKLGAGSWALNGCPMDGGGMVVNKNGIVQTVWNRKGTIYSDEPGKDETALGEGRSCTMESVNGKNVYAWIEKGEVVILKPQGMKKKLGEGQLPVIRAINNEHVICVWEKDKQIHKAIVEL